MKCPVCVEQGQRSKVFSNGSTKTLMGGGEPFWDEDGNYHRHDPNRVTSSFCCSTGHYFSETFYKACPNEDCDYGSEPPRRHIDQKSVATPIPRRY
jgi:hypothetical protein